jgi:hypothetical protein
MTARGGFLAGLWLIVFPALGLGLYFGVYAPGYHPAPPGQAQPFSCSSEMASLAAVDGGGQIAPLCGAVSYPAVTP